MRETLTQRGDNRVAEGQIDVCMTPCKPRLLSGTPRHLPINVGFEQASRRQYAFDQRRFEVPTLQLRQCGPQCTALSKASLPRFPVTPLSPLASRSPPPQFLQITLICISPKLMPHS